MKRLLFAAVMIALVSPTWAQVTMTTATPEAITSRSIRPSCSRQLGRVWLGAARMNGTDANEHDASLLRKYAPVLKYDSHEAFFAHHVRAMTDAPCWCLARATGGGGSSRWPRNYAGLGTAPTRSPWPGLIRTARQPLTPTLTRMSGN